MNPARMDSSCPVSHFLLVQQQWIGSSPSSHQSLPPPNAAELSIGRRASSAEALHRSIEARQFRRSEPSVTSSDAPAVSASRRPSTSALWDAVPGAVGGFCSVVIGHPLDLLKVRMQAGTSPSSQLSPSAAGPGASPTLHGHPQANHRQMTTSASGPWGHRLSRSFQNNRLLLSSLAQRAPRTGHLGVWNTGASPAMHWGMAGTGAVRSGGVGTTSAWGGAAVARAPVLVESPAPTSIRGMAMDVVRQNGIRGLYAGMTAPLVAVVPAFGVTIWSFEAAKRQLILRRPEGHDPGSVSSSRQQLAVSEAALAGAASGVLAAFVLGPLEKIKCEFQLHPTRYRSFLDCVRVQLAGNPQHLSASPPRLMSWSLSNPYAASPSGPSFSAVGRIRELFRGTFLTVCRDVPGNATYFAVHEMVRRTLLSNAWQPETDDVSSSSSSSRRRLMATAVAGGIAGVVNWCLCLPVDAVKTRWQTAPVGTYSSPLHVLRDMLREGGIQAGGPRRTGISALYRGLGPAVLRAFPANAVALCAVDLTRQVLGMPTL